jgi:hypothetical protein
MRSALPGHKAYIVYCPKHAAVDALLEACETRLSRLRALMREIRRYDWYVPGPIRDELHKIMREDRTAIAAARGEGE